MDRNREINFSYEEIKEMVYDMWEEYIFEKKFGPGAAVWKILEELTGAIYGKRSRQIYTYFLLSQLYIKQPNFDIYKEFEDKTPFIIIRLEDKINEYIKDLQPHEIQELLEQGVNLDRKRS